MALDPIAARYAQAAFEAAKDAGAVEKTLEQLSLIGRLIREHPELRQLLFNPDGEAQEKLGVLERVLKGAWSDVVRAFIQVVVSRSRSELLPEMADAFQTLVDKDQGRLRAVVRCAHPLPEAVLSRLRKRLEHRERKEIVVTTAVDPELLGGLQILLDHRVIDSSVQRQLAQLRQQLKTVRVTS